MTFRRARSEEQREERRRAILETTAAMLAEMPVAEVSLNEISRRTGLAKSNVLRYVESREAALLTLLHERLHGWVGAIEAVPTSPGTTLERIDALAGLLASTLDERPVLCDLLATQEAVLERNVSTDLAVEHKRTFLAVLAGLAGVVRRHVPELEEPEATKAAAATLLCAGGAWTASHPSPAVIDAYAREPALAAWRLAFDAILRELIGVLLAGLLARQG